MIKKKLFACVLAVALAVTGVGNVYASDGVTGHYNRGNNAHLGGEKKTGANGTEYYVGGTWYGTSYDIIATRYDNKLVINSGNVVSASYWDCFKDIAVTFELHHSGTRFGWSCGISNLLSIGCTIMDLDDCHTITFACHNDNWCDIDFNNIEFKCQGGDAFKISASGAFRKGSTLYDMSTGTEQYVWD